MFDTVTLRCELELLPAASRATAVSECPPLATFAVLQLSEYGALVSSDPTFEPSTLNCTPTTATLSDAVAATLAVPDTVAPADGLVSPTDGAVVSAGGGGGAVGLATVILCSRLEDFPAESCAVTRRTWVPFDDLVVSHGVSYGAAVSFGASGVLSTSNVIPATDSSTCAVTSTVAETVAPSAGLTVGQTFFGEFPLHWASGWPAPANPTEATMLAATSAVTAYKRRAGGKNVYGGICSLSTAPPRA